MTAMELNIPVVAGLTATLIFALSTLPMVWKAYRTRDLRSYSLGNIALANLGNLAYSVYVFALPFGPIWLLHSFYLVTTGLMLAWYVRFELVPRRMLRSRRQEYPAAIPHPGQGSPLSGS
jgi:uncharacterized protein with PQ loop repeat